MSQANKRHLGYAGSVRSSNDNASGGTWGTPREWVEKFAAVLDGIELDPFSSHVANTIVLAKRFFSVEDDAFAQPEWVAQTAFMNPPYSRSLCAKAVSRLIHEYEVGNTRSAIALVNNSTETLWFQRIAKVARMRCDIFKRIGFVSVDGKHISGNTRGQVVFL